MADELGLSVTLELLSSAEENNLRPRPGTMTINKRVVQW